MWFAMGIIYLLKCLEGITCLYEYETYAWCSVLTEEPQDLLPRAGLGAELSPGLQKTKVSLWARLV